MSETKKQRIDREMREYFDSVRGKSGVVEEKAKELNVEHLIIPKEERDAIQAEANIIRIKLLKDELASTATALFQTRKELRDLIHSDYCSKGCRPRCVELARLLGEK